jgi:putative lipoprotein
VVKLLTALAALSIVVAACGSDNEVDGPGSSVSGTIEAPTNGPPADGFPEGSVLTVRLDDISRADAPATTLASEELDLDGAAFPIEFELSYDSDDIDERFTYAVSARIEYQGDLLAVTDTVVPVITNDAPTSGVSVPLVLTTAG